MCVNVVVYYLGFCVCFSHFCGFILYFTGVNMKSVHKSFTVFLIKFSWKSAPISSSFCRLVSVRAVAIFKMNHELAPQYALRVKRLSC